MYLEPPRSPRGPAAIWPWILSVIVAFGAAWYLYTKQTAIIEAVRGPLPAPTPTEISAAQYLSLGDSRFADGRYDEAVAAYRRASELDPTLSLAYARWARIMTLRQNPKEAERLARRAVEIDAEQAENQAILGFVLDWHIPGYYAEAVSICTGAVARAPQKAYGYSCLAEAYADLGRPDLGLGMAEKALELAPDDLFARRALAYVNEVSGRYAAAIREYEAALEAHPQQAFLYVDLGRIYRGTGKLDEAVAQFELATQVDPGSALGFDQLGWAYFAQGNYELAIAQLLKAIDVDPSYAPAYTHLGVTYYTTRNYEEAIRRLQEAVDRGAITDEIAYEMGFCYAYLDNCEKAKEWFHKALELDPTSTVAHQGLEYCR